MPGYHEVQGIVLRVQEHREADRRVTLLTPEGRVQARAPGARKAKSRLGSILQPAAVVQVTLYALGRMPTITGASSIEAFRPLQEDLLRLSAAQVLLEICDVTVGEEDAVRPFLALAKALRRLSEAEDPAAAWLLGELELLSAYGWGLQLERCASCGGELAPPLRYPVDLGGFVCKRCAAEGGVNASAEAVSALRSVVRGENQETGASDARQLLHLTWQAHLEGQLRSVAFAESVFGR
ncbi:MAG: DNA repair protein RecO [Thermaerobacter sp.]|nr:DNA repair protein RecO [Thermaerobacter sp.]